MGLTLLYTNVTPPFSTTVVASHTHFQPRNQATNNQAIDINQTMKIIKTSHPPSPVQLSLSLYTRAQQNMDVQGTASSTPSTSSAMRRLGRSYTTRRVLSALAQISPQLCSLRSNPAPDASSTLRSAN
jgi:hypothetical protein